LVSLANTLYPFQSWHQSTWRANEEYETSKLEFQIADPKSEVSPLVRASAYARYARLTF